MTSERPEAALRGFERSLPMALMRARESVMRYFRPTLAEHDLTEQQWRVLRALTSADAPMSVGDLAALANLLGPSLSRMLVNLEARGLISRSPGAADGRRADIAVSEAGRTLVADIAPISESQYRAIESALGADELQRLYELLERVAHLDVADG